MTKKTLHFSLGPVQGFVAQARRTRDSWVGSFLLSWLTGQAMHAVCVSGGRIVFPVIEDDALMKAVTDVNAGRQPGEIPPVATLPNRFMAEIPPDFDPDICRQAVLSEWQRIADSVYKEYILPVENLGDGTRAIWDRQIQGFWDITWAVGEDRRILDRRKSWRVHVPTIEPGDKCFLVGNLQELSGHIRSVSGEIREKQDAFWNQLAGTVGNSLKEKERLCAVAFVKRMFPAVSNKVILGKVPESYPSTPSLAAAHWLKAVVETQSDVCLQFAEKAGKLGRNTERKVRLVEELVKDHPQMTPFLNLDPNCFYVNSLENDDLWEDGANAQFRQELRQMLSNRFKQNPSPFFALLLMDGDKMGRLLSDNAQHVDKISMALSKFSKGVPDIVEKHNGVCVYAGGDDVFAMLPLEDALPASIELKKKYRDIFQDALNKEPKLQNIDKATISGAIVYAHQNLPLQVIINEAHNTLDGVAKEKTGRDSLAIKVWKSSGPNLCWSAPWEVVEKVEPTLTNQDKTEFTNSFLYNIRQRFDLLSGESQPQLFEPDQVQQILEAEYIKTRGLKKEGEDEAVFRQRVQANVAKLLEICLVAVNKDNVVCRSSELKLDGALLIKFLANRGVAR